MPPQSVSKAGSTDSAAEEVQLPATLAERLHEVADDRAATSEALILETTQIVLEWLDGRPDEWTWCDAARDLEAGLAEWNLEQNWRGPVAMWMDSLRRAWHYGRVAYPDRARLMLSEELGLWVWGRGADAAAVRELEGFDGPWDGEPLAPGERLPSRAQLARHAAASFGHEEVVLINAYSDTVASALEAAWRAGRRPEVLACECLPTLEGRRMVGRLARAGIRVGLCYDAALNAALPRADRVWLATEAIGVDTFVARIGTRALLEEAARLDVPAFLLATSDKLMPGGAITLPSWTERDTWLLWHESPEGVRLETQCFETVPLDLVERLITEVGSETPAELCMRALRASCAAPMVAAPTDEMPASDFLMPRRVVQRATSPAEPARRDERHTTMIDDGNLA